MYRTYNARPIPRPTAQKKSRKPFGLFAAIFVIVLAGSYIGYALLRPLPAVHTTITPPLVPALVHVSIPWPANAQAKQAAFGAAGYGLLAQSGTETPLPTASVAKVITALAVLDKKPLKPGEQGPVITITAHDIDLYNSYVSRDGSVVPVSVGETITEYQALQAMMLPSANNIADTLADWAFGDLPTYNASANSYVKKLGMTSTTVTDASGFAPTTLSTAGDLVKLGGAALANPVLADIVNQKTAEFPEYGTIHNVNALLGQSGVRGIKTGNTDDAGGVYLGAADVMVGGQKISVITAIMGATDLGQALRSTVPLVLAAPSEFQTVHIVRTGQIVGKATAVWGSTSAIKATKDITVTTWTGTAVAPTGTTQLIRSPAVANSKAGSLELTTNGSEQSSEVVLDQAISPPGVWWRLQHPF